MRVRKIHKTIQENSCTSHTVINLKEHATYRIVRRSGHTNHCKQRYIVTYLRSIVMNHFSDRLGSQVGDTGC